MNNYSHVSMKVLGGFTTVLGLTGVAYALTVLQAPFLVTACIVTALGLAATLAGISFFSNRANLAPPVVLHVPPIDYTPHPLSNLDVTFSDTFRDSLRTRLDQMLADARSVTVSRSIVDDNQLLGTIVPAWNTQSESNLRHHSILNDSMFNSNVSRESAFFNDNQGNNYPDLSNQSASLNEISY